MDESKMHRCSVISEDLLEFSDNLIDPEDTTESCPENVSEDTTNDSVDVRFGRKISVESKNSQRSIASKSLEEESETGLLPNRNSTTSSSSKSEDSSISNKNESPSVAPSVASAIARSQPTSARGVGGGGSSSSHQKRSFNCTLQIEQRPFAEETNVISTTSSTQYNVNTAKSSGSDLANRKDPNCCNNENYLTSNTKSYDREESDKLVVVGRSSDLSRQSDHVSCEDLLEFACDGPNARRTRGPRNGEHSDEVRIMLKVLHDQSTPESCIAALNVTGWDVLTAIKLERLQGLLKRENNFVGLEDCKLMLSQCGGDVVKAAALLRNTDDTAAV